jgi:hypothetical protein
MANEELDGARFARFLALFLPALKRPRHVIGTGHRDSPGAKLIDHVYDSFVWSVRRQDV